jgi:hypothetical protein
MVSKYIEAPSGADFEIRIMYKAPFTPNSPIHPYIMLDDNYILAPLIESASKDGCEGYKYAKSTSIVDGISSTQNFRFSDLVAGKLQRSYVGCVFPVYDCIKERDEAVTAGAKRKISGISQITVYLYYMEGIEDARPVEIPRSDLGQTETFSHKATKINVTAGDSLAYQTR